jgi:hypothetical protein
VIIRVPDSHVYELPLRWGLLFFFFVGFDTVRFGRQVPTSWGRVPAPFSRQLHICDSQNIDSTFIINVWVRVHIYIYIYIYQTTRLRVPKYSNLRGRRRNNLKPTIIMCCSARLFALWHVTNVSNRNNKITRSYETHPWTSANWRIVTNSSFSRNWDKSVLWKYCRESTNITPGCIFINSIILSYAFIRLQRVLHIPPITSSSSSP